MRFHYQLPGENKLEVFEQNDDFLIRFDNFMTDISERPKIGVYKETISYELPTYSQAELQQLIATMKTNAGFSLKGKPALETPNSLAKNGFFARFTSFFK
jgi:hypothetical protein